MATALSRGRCVLDLRAELNKALALGEVDRQIDVLERERQDLRGDARGLELRKGVETHRRRIAALEGALAATERQQRLDDLERQERETDRERDTQRLYAGTVRSSRDVEGLQKNLAGTGARIGELETAILEAMERGEKLNGDLETEREELARAEAHLRAHAERSRRRLGEIDGALPLLGTRRAAQAGAIDAGLLREYERIRRRAEGVAVAPAAGGTCGVCGLQLSPLVEARLRKLDSPVYCENCGRLLAPQ